MSPVVISIRPQWSRLIRSGAKTIELRRRFPLLPASSMAFLYESSPTCGLVSVLRISAVHEMPVKELWRVHGEASCVQERQFAEYFEGRRTGFGIEIAECHVLPTIVDLADLRKRFEFAAPQSWAYATPALVSGLSAPK